MAAFDLATIEKISAALPGWRGQQMRDAFEVFESLDQPSGAEEEWRYVELGFKLDDLQPSIEPGESMAAGPFLQASRAESAGSALVVDGWVTDIDVEIEGVEAERLGASNRFESAAVTDRDKFAAAHGAFAGDGLRITVAPGAVIEAPIVVDVQATQADRVSFPHLEVSLGANAEASVLVVYRSPDGIAAVAVPSILLDTGDGARLRYLAVQGWGSDTMGLSHQRVRLGRDATGRIGEVGLGAKVGRLDLNVELEGSGSSVEVVGLYFGENAQTHDYRMVINHIGRNTSSDVFLKGAVEDSAQSIFTGLLRIEKDAIRSSAFETNRNLVLSEEAKAHSVPNLEILCDDVICGHGSSVGPLERDHLYYLQSRGISRVRAERMLIRGFFTEVIDRLPIDIVADQVSEAVFRRFLSAQEEGRLS